MKLYYHYAIISICFIGIITSCKHTSSIQVDNPVMKLVFTRDNEIYLFDMLSDSLELLLPLNEPVWTNELGFTYYRIWADQAHWSPSGDEIVYIEAVGTDGGHLRTLNPTTGEQQFFPYYVYRQDISPEWSIDGNYIIYSKSLASLGLNYEIFIINIDGLNDKQITDRPFHDDVCPSLHPNGVDIIFNSSDNRVTDFPNIFHTTTSMDSSICLSCDDYQISLQPKYNPVTAEIIFAHRSISGDNLAIYKVPDNFCSNPVQLVDSIFATGGFSWSNDGNFIVFVRVSGGIHGPYTNPEIWMMNSDGSEKMMVVKNATSPSLWVQ
ncbi:MAG: TolB family protein [Candidatus Neomarinimicrobiota bacterium]